MYEINTKQSKLLTTFKKKTDCVFQIVQNAVWHKTNRNLKYEKNSFNNSNYINQDP